MHKIDKNGASRRATEVNCEYCKKLFVTFTAPSRRSRFCSSACSNGRFVNRIKFNCAQCKKEFEKKPSTQSNSKSGLRFCSKACKCKAQRLGGIEAIQPDHYGDGKWSYRARALQLLPNCCNRCGYNKYIEVLEVHHKDSNRANNQIDNLEIVCANCHRETHLVK